MSPSGSTMRLRTPNGAHLTYCTNVHPAKSWEEVRRMLDGPVADVRRCVSPEQSFGVGLRLSSRALRELMSPLVRAELEFVLERHGMYVFTLALNDSRYRPDWLEHARLAYTCRGADLLASLLPEGVVGSISTVPGAHGERAQSRGARSAVASRLLAAAAHLADLEVLTGRRIVLSVSPEPGCMLEGAFDTVSFFRDHVFHGEALRAARVDERTARKHLGVCLDACHLAFAFEKPLDALSAFAREGIAVGKLQVSATQDLEQLVRLAVERNTTTNFEVETCVSLVEEVARELQWTKNVAEGS